MSRKKYLVTASVKIERRATTVIDAYNKKEAREQAPGRLYSGQRGSLPEGDTLDGIVVRRVEEYQPPEARSPTDLLAELVESVEGGGSVVTITDAKLAEYRAALEGTQ